MVRVVLRTSIKYVDATLSHVLYLAYLRMYKRMCMHACMGNYMCTLVRRYVEWKVHCFECKSLTELSDLCLQVRVISRPKANSTYTFVHTYLCSVDSESSPIPTQCVSLQCITYIDSLYKPLHLTPCFSRLASSPFSSFFSHSFLLPLSLPLLPLPPPSYFPLPPPFSLHSPPTFLSPSPLPGVGS